MVVIVDYRCRHSAAGRIPRQGHTFAEGNCRLL